MKTLKTLNEEVQKKSTTPGYVSTTNSSVVIIAYTVVSVWKSGNSFYSNYAGKAFDIWSKECLNFVEPN